MGLREEILAGAGLTKSGNTLNVGTGIAVATDTVTLTGNAPALHNLATNGLVARTAAATVAARGSGSSTARRWQATLNLESSLASVGNLTPVADNAICEL